MSDIKPKGFAALSEERRKEIQNKATIARQKKAAKGRKAAELRSQANKLEKQVETLREQADEIDGGVTSSKAQERKKLDLRKEFEDYYGNSISSQFLEALVQHAIKNNYSADESITPIQKALDIIRDPEASNKEQLDAIRLVKDFELAKAAQKVDEEEHIGSINDEMEGLLAKMADMGPKR